MRRFYLPVLLLISIAGLSHCGDKGNAPPPPDTPGIIQLSKPIVNTIYINGTNLLIQGNIEDADGLSAVKVEVKKTSNNEVLFQQSLSAAGVTFYTLDRSWTVTGITGSVNAVVKVTATDRYSYQVIKEINIVLAD